jgi:hypothetical protein
MHDGRPPEQGSDIGTQQLVANCGLKTGASSQSRFVPSLSTDAKQCQRWRGSRCGTDGHGDDRTPFEVRHVPVMRSVMCSVRNTVFCCVKTCIGFVDSRCLRVPQLCLIRWTSPCCISQAWRCWGCCDVQRDRISTACLAVEFFNCWDWHTGRRTLESTPPLYQCPLFYASEVEGIGYCVCL